MGIEEFCKEVIKCLLEVMDEDTDIKVQKVYKNNGICLHCIVMGDGLCVPNIYMNEYYHKYQTGNMSLTQIAIDVLEQRENMEEKKIEPVMDFRWESVKDKIFYRLVNLQMNKKKLENMPHREYLDLAIVCRMLHFTDDIGMASSEITYEELDMFGVTEEELFQQAEQNTERLFPMELQSLVSVIRNTLKQRFESDELIQMVLGIENLESEVNMYVLSNTTGVHGAVTMLYKDVLKQIAIQLKTDILYLLPSSVHEIMVVPECKNVEFLKELVTDANRFAVAGIDLLSDHVYRYDKNTDMVDIAA